jgi:hypothetical protein
MPRHLSPEKRVGTLRTQGRRVADSRAKQREVGFTPVGDTPFDMTVAALAPIATEKQRSADVGDGHFLP